MKAVAALVMALVTSPALARDQEHPERNQWMAELNNSAGIRCCGINDYNVIKDVPWDTYRDAYGFAHYKVFIAGDWLKVDDDKIVKAPNPYAVPILWYYHESGIFQIKCFLPGAGL